MFACDTKKASFWKTPWKTLLFGAAAILVCFSCTNLQEELGYRSPQSSSSASSGDQNPPDKVNLDTLSAIAANQQVRLFWEDPTNQDLASLQLSWSPDGTTGISIAPGTEEYTVSSLNNGTRYTFTLVATDSNDNVSDPQSCTAQPHTEGQGNQKEHTVSGVDFSEISVPAMTFPTGSSDDSTATVSETYWLAATETAYELWYPVRSWATNNGYTFANPGRGGINGTNGAAPGATKKHPVTVISWWDAVVWCNAFTEFYNTFFNAGLSCVYTVSGSPLRDATDTATSPTINASADGFRLPDHNEWELAARFIEDSNSDGAITNSGEYYPGGAASGAMNPVADNAETKACAWFGGNYYPGDPSNTGTTQDVGQKPASGNGLGFFDMSGNVMEFCQDNNSIGLGGNWYNTYTLLKIGGTLFISPTGAAGHIGLRVGRN